MRIGFLQTRFAATGTGGAEIHTEHLARALEARGHTVTICTARPKERRPYTPDLDVREYPVPLHKNPVEELMLAHRAWDDLCECDVVTLTDDSAYRGVDLPVPTVMVFHFVWHGWLAHNKPLANILVTKPQALVYSWMEHKIASNVDRIIAISSNMFEDITRIGDFSGKIESIPNGVNIEKFHPSAQKSDTFTIHYQGRLIDLKNPDVLIEAAKLSDRPWHLTVGGTGPLEEHLQELVDKYDLSERVTLLGYLEEDDMIDRYQHSHIYTLPSTYEGMPLTVLEAAACGTAIVASPRAGTEFVDDSIGWTIEPDATTLANKFDELYDQQNEVLRRGRNARSKAEHHSWENIAKEYETLYRQLNNEAS